MTEIRPTWGTLVRRALRLVCPRCGQSPLFAGWFRMRVCCDRCGLPFRREPGFYLGSIYFNYGLTALAVTLGYVIPFALGHRPGTIYVAALGAFCALFPVWFFRYARALWLAFDEHWDPQQASGGGTKAE